MPAFTFAASLSALRAAGEPEPLFSSSNAKFYLNIAVAEAIPN
jgi:hypothetical protein